ncbi:MAG: hypothetical protein HZA81_02700 [Candidatus Taylorbacteria bacterium]|nr:hypothetical protein [Candidatus Taylorbacteria bacterium]
MDAVNFLNLEYLFLRIFEFFKNFDIVALLNRLIAFLDILKPIAIIVSLFLFFVIVYSHIRIKQLEEKEKEEFEALKAKDAANQPGQDTEMVEKWQKVVAHINSNNPSDWRLAILEADIMLDSMLDKMGYQGDTMAEKFRGIAKGDFLTLQLAQEAHGVRNRIAHDGSSYPLNEREAKAVIDKYKQVFSEFYHI